MYSDRAAIVARQRQLAELLLRVAQLEQRPIPPFEPDLFDLLPNKAPG